MTQISDIRRGSRRLGIKRTIKVPAILASAMKQYDKNNVKLKSGNAVFGSFNAFSVFNADVVDVEIALDFTEEKTYPIPAGSLVSVDEIDYQEFNITNLSAVTAVTADKITFTAIYENPLDRERIPSYKRRGGK